MRNDLLLPLAFIVLASPISAISSTMTSMRTTISNTQSVQRNSHSYRSRYENSNSPYSNRNRQRRAVYTNKSILPMSPIDTEFSILPGDLDLETYAMKYFYQQEGSQLIVDLAHSGEKGMSVASYMDHLNSNGRKFTESALELGFMIDIDFSKLNFELIKNENPEVIDVISQIQAEKETYLEFVNNLDKEPSIGAFKLERPRIKLKSVDADHSVNRAVEYFINNNYQLLNTDSEKFKKEIKKIIASKRNPKKSLKKSVYCLIETFGGCGNISEKDYVDQILPYVEYKMRQADYEVKMGVFRLDMEEVYGPELTGGKLSTNLDGKIHGGESFVQFLKRRNKVDLSILTNYFNSLKVNDFLSVGERMTSTQLAEHKDDYDARKARASYYYKSDKKPVECDNLTCLMIKRRGQQQQQQQK